MTSHSIDDHVAVPDPHTSRRLFQLGAGALAAAILGLVYQSPVQDVILLAMAAGIMILAALPALNWARKGELHFPVFEMFMLTSIPFYAVPLLAGHPAVLQFSDQATMTAALALLIFNACAVTTFAATRGRPIRSRTLTVSLLPSTAPRYVQTGIWLNTAYLYVQTFTDLIPYQFNTIFRAMFFGIGTVSLFIQMRRWGSGDLEAAAKFTVALNVVVQLMILFRGLYLIVGLSVLLLALIGYVSTSRRIPLLVIAIVLPVVAVLHTGKTAMRLQYWGPGAPTPTVGELPGFFQEWFEHGLARSSLDEEAGSATLTGRLFERASLFQMLCLVTERTPAFEPYLMGESYKYVPSQLIPSILWPNKPSSLMSNVLLALHYGLVSESNPTSVSIAFGMVAESYANFGLIGCALLGVMLGYGYKRISLAALGRPQFSALGLLTILLAAWSFQVEQIFASWFVSLIQAAIVVIGGPMLFRMLFGDE